ncbi:MAG: ferrochelatase, partial [Rhodospirillales bacterium]|nr:ferrochelatase [Rhodospirillales bacterium]
EKELAGGDGVEVRVFIAMRYWHPRARQTAAEVAEFDPDEIVLLPLYPQFSTTTTASSLEEWRGEAIKVGLNVPSYAICCYPAHAGFIRAQAQILQTTLGSAPAGKPMRVLFSAHGLPEKIVQSGDPYPDQALKSAVAIAAAAGLIEADWALCYQSRVGPLKWIGPSLGDELARAAHDQVGVVILPIAFVSEHSETLVELDMEYRHIAENLGVAPYLRAPALADNSEFITGLADIVRAAFAGKAAIMSAGPGHACSAPPSSCPLHAAN